jgi:hypothetical protein
VRERGREEREWEDREKERKERGEREWEERDGEVKNREMIV